MDALAGTWRPPTLETPRLWLRPLAAADIPAVFAYSSNPVVTRYTLWDAHADVEDSRWFVSVYAAGRYREGIPEPLGIVLKPDAGSPVVGTAGCFWVSRDHRCMELGYALGEPHWGQGIVAEACGALVAHAFAAYDVHRIQARVIAGNDASEAVLRKLGFAFEGTLRGAMCHRATMVDVRMYAKLRDGVTET